MSWETLKVNPNYEILKRYPYPIRRRLGKHIIAIGSRIDGYQRVYLDRKEYLKHQIVAKQWLPNPNNCVEIDHKNRMRDDNHIDNLNWVTRSENNFNRNIPKHYKKHKKFNLTENAFPGNGSEQNMASF